MHGGESRLREIFDNCIEGKKYNFIAESETEFIKREFQLSSFPRHAGSYTDESLGKRMNDGRREFEKATKGT